MSDVKRTPAEKRLHCRVGRRVSELRQRAGFSQEQFAEALAVSTKYLQRVEAGQENLSLSTLLKLARPLRADVSEFLKEPPAVRRGRGHR